MKQRRKNRNEGRKTRKERNESESTVVPLLKHVPRHEDVPIA